MGFNLQSFFYDLIAILSSSDTDFNKVQKLIDTICEAKKYAKECGALK